MGWLRLSFHIARAHTKMNYYAYALFRRSYLDLALPMPDVTAGDRLFVLQAAMSGRLRYVDAPLLVRHISTATIGERYVDDAYGQTVRARRRHLRYLGALVKYLYNSPAIPPRRKVAIPMLAVTALSAHVVAAAPTTVRHVASLARRTLAEARAGA